MLVLHTRGRRTGRRRDTPLAVHEAADGTLWLVGGAGGQTAIPDWVANLRAEPAAEVTLDRRRLPVLATEVTGPDRDGAWRTLREVWPRIDVYERRAGRPVPVFRLDRC